MWTKVEGAWVAVLPDAWQGAPLVVILRDDQPCGRSAEAFMGPTRAMSFPAIGDLCALSSVLNLWRELVEYSDMHNSARHVAAMGRTLAWAESIGIPADGVPHG
jgi:hypothetical protein